MELTVAKLKRLNACEDQVQLFEELYPEGVEITEAACLAVADRFNWDWAAERLLPEALRAEYERVSGPAWVEFERVRGPAWVEYQRALTPAWAEYQRARASAWAEYQRVLTPVLAEYKRATASTFGRLMEGK